MGLPMFAYHAFSWRGSNLKTDLALSWGIFELYRRDNLDLHQVASSLLVFILSRVLGETCPEPQTVLKSEDIYVMPLVLDLQSKGMN